MWSKSVLWRSYLLNCSKVVFVVVCTLYKKSANRSLSKDDLEPGSWYDSIVLDFKPRKRDKDLIHLKYIYNLNV